MCFISNWACYRKCKYKRRPVEEVERRGKTDVAVFDWDKCVAGRSNRAGALPWNVFINCITDQEGKRLHSKAFTVRKPFILLVPESTSSQTLWMFKFHLLLSDSSGPICWHAVIFWTAIDSRVPEEERMRGRWQIDGEDASPFVMCSSRQIHLGALYQKVNGSQIHK